MSITEEIYYVVKLFCSINHLSSNEEVDRYLYIINPFILYLPTSLSNERLLVKIISTDRFNPLYKIQHADTPLGIFFNSYFVNRTYKQYYL